MTARSVIGSVPTSFGAVEVAVVGLHLDLGVVGFAVQGDDVGVGHHVAVGAEDDAGAGSGGGAAGHRDGDDRRPSLRGDGGDVGGIGCVVDGDRLRTSGRPVHRAKRLVRGERPDGDSGTRDSTDQGTDRESRDDADIAGTGGTRRWRAVPNRSSGFRVCRAVVGVASAFRGRVCDASASSGRVWRLSRSRSVSRLHRLW